MMKNLKKLLLSLVLILAAGSAFAVRTVVFIYKVTQPGQDIFIKGGHDAGLVPSVYPSMSEPITYLNTKNTTTAAIKAADASLDWGSESALDWTCNAWPADWGAKKTYAVDGYGEDPENTMGLHWWKFDVDMAGSAGEWFEFKAFMREGTSEWWETDRAQAGTPYSTINHWGKKGYITKVKFDDNWVEFDPLSVTPNNPPVASLSVSPASGTVATSFTADASASSDPEDGANVQVRFDWNNDGTYDTAYSSTKTANHSYSSIGTKTIKVEVKDSKGLTATATKSLTINNTPPTASFTVSPASGTLATTFTADASASSDLEDGSAIQVRWDWDNNGSYDTGWSTTKTASHQYSSLGTKTIRLEVKDSQGLTASVTKSVSISDGGSNPFPGYYSGKLGANLYSDGVEFSIWDPNASSVKVLTINNYVSNYTSLTKISGGVNDSVWWGFVPTAVKGTEYRFVLDQTTYVADPYAQYNRYSSGNSVVVDQSTFTWTDSSWTRPGWSYYAIYELHIKDFTSADSTVVNKGKYKGVIEKLDYLKNLGVTAIELMPISEFPDAGYGWGYNTSLYMSPESGYANSPLHAQDGVDELKELINAAHNKGIAVVLDMVFNHTANNDNWLWTIDSAAYFSGATPWGNRLNTSSAIVQRLGSDTIDLFMRKYHVDGFRFDATGNGWVDYNFLHVLKNHAMSIDPKVYFVYENLPNNPDLKTWGGQWADGFHDNGVNLLCGWNGVTASSFAKYIYYSKDEGWAASPVEALNYFESHDEDTLGRLFGIAGFSDEGKRWKSRVAAVTLATSLGVPMIWMGQEFIRPREGQDISEIPLDWSYLSKFSGVENYYAGVFRLRRDNPALRLDNESGFAWQYTPWTGDADVIGYSEQTTDPADKKFVVLLNFNSSSRTVNLGFPENGTWTEVITETAVDQTGTINVSGNSHSVTIQGSSGIIFMK